MIVDTAKVSLSDGTQTQAIGVFPGRELLSYESRKMTRVRVKDRKVQMQSDVIGLLLSNGQRLCGSRDQLVGVCLEKSVKFRPLADVNIGDHLRGERAGMPVTLDVIGLLFYPKTVVRVVEFTLGHNKNFVAEGVLCRS